MDPDLRELLTQTITLARTSADAYSRTTAETPRTYRCRLERTDREIHGADGRVRIAGTVAIVDAPAGSITLDDEVTLADGAHPSLHCADAVYDEVGFSHYELFLGITPPRGT